MNRLIARLVTLGGVGVFAVVFAACAAGPAGGGPDPLSLPVCDDSTVGVSKGYLEKHGPWAVQELVRELEWFSADGEPALVPVSRGPRLRNQAEVARSLKELWPKDLRDRGVGGEVRFHFLLDEEGRIDRRQLARGASHPAFNAAGAGVLGGMRFDPVVHEGCRIPIFVADFRLFFEVADVPPRKW